MASELLIQTEVTESHFDFLFPGISEVVISMKAPKYRKHSRANFGFVEWQGERHQLPGAYNSPQSLAAYYGFLREKVLDSQRGGRPLSVAGLACEFLAFAREYYPAGHNSEFQNCKHAIAWLLKLFASRSIHEFGPRDLKQLQQAMADAGVSRRHINAQLGRVKRMFKWGASEELFPIEVYSALKTVAGLRAGRSKAKELPPRRPVEWKDVEPVFSYLTPDAAAMLRLQWYTGARSSSVCAAKPEQFERGETPWLWRPRHKTEHLGKEAIIPIAPRLQPILDPYFDRPADAPMFTSRRGTLYNTVSYRLEILRAQQKAGVPEWVPHQLRHARGTLVRATYGLEAAQAVLCHDSIAATQIYAERQLELAKRVAMEMG